VSAGNSEGWWRFLASLELNFCKWSWGFGVLNAEKYRQILIHHAIASGRHLIVPKSILQHDNDPKHTVLNGFLYLQREGVLEVTVCPPHSPDLNIESVWDYMKSEEHLRLPKSTELWLVLQDVWANLPAKFL
jgi:hypothetical protein